MSRLRRASSKARIASNLISSCWRCSRRLKSRWKMPTESTTACAMSAFFVRSSHRKPAALRVASSAVQQDCACFRITLAFVSIHRNNFQSAAPYQYIASFHQCVCVALHCFQENISLYSPHELSCFKCCWLSVAALISKIGTRWSSASSKPQARPCFKAARSSVTSLLCIASNISKLDAKSLRNPKKKTSTIKSKLINFFWNS